MKAEEIAIIQSKRNAAIVAPAGHGKTEMIVDLVEAAKGKVLLVTHTNAGVYALTKRLKKRGVNSTRYSITTIAGFSLRWCMAYPKTGSIRHIATTDKDYYPMLYDGAISIFKNTWARDVLRRSYNTIIVDEYQDCILPQHQIFVEINKTVRVIVLGDPLQAIFGWAGKLVSWRTLGFERIEIETYPWRWEHTNPLLGKYLNDIRKSLLPGLDGQRIRLELKDVVGCIQVMPSSCKQDYSLINSIRNYDNAVYITRWKPDQEAFSRTTGGIFQNDEAQAINILFETAIDFDKRIGHISTKRLFEFLESCATGISSELRSYQRNIQKGNYEFKRIKSYPEFGKLINTVNENPNNDNIIAVIDWLIKNKNFKIYRKELLFEMRRALIYSKNNDISISDAAQRIRMIPGLQKEYPKFRMLSSRTVLSKGLEFDCVIIDLEKGISVTDFYVALTRAKKQVILISDRTTIFLDVPKL